ncbi:MAG: PLP-dependent aminotransferase family protein [Chloroflexi bacterium]|jgi:DNA-binding transcriptional MocR family regulator|nr:PLP-dependent aminotransferase family protein [Anaerolineaceae bacterium]NMB90232.1 PLP-dependent aminotransferase family protein [Chloroflexota bacterium]
MSPARKSPSPALYEQLAAELRAQIEAGAYPAGERLPSVRQMRQDRGLSPSTILQAYRQLEDAGLIEARPQSGYYVRARPLPHPPPEPEISAPPLRPENVSMDELMDRVLHEATQPHLMQFGTALPAPDLLPTRRLDRILVRIARQDRYPWNVYATPEGSSELRAQVSRRLGRLNCPVPAEDLLITNGCMEAIHFALRAVCRPGDLVAVESPTYFGLLQALEAEGLNTLEIPTHHRDGISLEALEFALEHHPIRAVVAIPNFQNPLGSCMPDEHKRQLVDLLARYETPLIEDDIYGELAFGERRPGLARTYDRQGLVLTCSSFSKDICPSFRVGWIAAGRYRGRVAQLKMVTNIGTAILPQLVIAEFVENGGYDNYLRGIRRAYAQKVAHMARAVLDYFPAGTRVTTPQGGYVLWVQMPEAVDSLALYQLALESGITLAPGRMFSATGKYASYVRLNAAYMDFAGQRALQRLGELAQRLNRRG